ncbi:MAG: ABC-F family ATP-binding cassette domain-containing protein [Blastochloris sp.]|nr:ABC-F family ATP-binding cassette domain-containing protein [Blastochloris sp.]
MLSLSNVSKAFGGRTLYEDVSLQINYGDRVAIVGSNGAGKSTLFSIILRENDPDAGTVSMDRNTTLGFLPQETAATGDETVLELATAITPEHARWRRILTQAEAEGDTESEAYHEAQSHYAELGGFQLDPKAKRILSGLAFRETDFNRMARTMSGGWIMRAHLARLLVMEPDLLMLDEPTNHLDLESLGWFQTYLQSYPGAILMISHDRAFLNALIDTILEIRNKKVHRYRGNYDDFVEQRAAREAQHLAAYKNQQKEIEDLQRFADRFRAKASKAAQAQSKLKQIDRMEKIEAPEGSEKRISINFPQPTRSGQRVVTLEKIHFAYAEQKIYQGIDFEAEREERIVLVGPNGAGKSTLLKILGAVVTPQEGVRNLGHNVQAGYYSQNRVEMLNPNRTVLQEALSIQKQVPEQLARTVLGSFLFQGDDVFKKTSVLSGGEKSRLALVKLLLDPPNLLLMDEPTTHLDMASIDALIDALQQYQGTVIFISHDVYFIRSLAKKVLHISAGQLTPYAGDYDYYLLKSKATSERGGLVAGEKLSNHRPEEELAEEVKPKVSVFKTKEQKRKEAEERQARSAAKKLAQGEAELLEKDIARMEARKKELVSALEDPENHGQGSRVVELNRELAALTEKLESANQRWLEKLELLEVSSF